jgi:hypothetical protein
VLYSRFNNPDREPAVRALLVKIGTFAVAATIALPSRADDASPGYSPPHVVDYAGGAIPPNGHLETRTNTQLLHAGIVTAALPYGFSLLYALSTCGAQMECRSGSAWLYLPFLGPLITAGYAPTSGGAALSVFDGGLQMAGLALMIASQTSPRTVVVWQDANAALRVMPTVTPGGAGVSLTLTSM